MITGWTRLGLDRDDPSVRSIGEIGKRQREIMERKRRVPLFFFFRRLRIASIAPHGEAWRARARRAHGQRGVSR